MSQPRDPSPNPESTPPTAPLKPRRRPRYPGRNPRLFAHKYKEHAPDQHPDTIAKVRAGGKTPAGAHVPIMVEEVLAALAPQPGQTGADVTLGHGGHAQALLERLRPGGVLLGLDTDPIELPRTETRLRQLGFTPQEFIARRTNYAGLPSILAELQLGPVDFVLADLGCSSMQLDDPARGFGFKEDGPLDMRMNPARGLPAGEWLARVPAERLAAALRDHADEPRHHELARALAGQRLATTHQLAGAIRAALPPRTRPEEAAQTIRRVFQAVRIAVNDEFSALDNFLRVLPSCLKAGGRVAVLTFHSGEDRRVKQSFAAGLREGVYAEASDSVVTASPAERRANPRSAPAKLRWAIRSGVTA